MDARYGKSRDSIECTGVCKRRTPVRDRILVAERELTAQGSTEMSRMEGLTGLSFDGRRENYHHPNLAASDNATPYLS